MVQDAVGGWCRDLMLGFPSDRRSVKPDADCERREKPPVDQDSDIQSM